MAVCSFWVTCLLEEEPESHTYSLHIFLSNTHKHIRHLVCICRVWVYLLSCLHKYSNIIDMVEYDSCLSFVITHITSKNVVVFSGALWTVTPNCGSQTWQQRNIMNIDTTSLAEDLFPVLRCFYSNDAEICENIVILLLTGQCSVLETPVIHYCNFHRNNKLHFLSPPSCLSSLSFLWCHFLCFSSSCTALTRDSLSRGVHSDSDL